jgi:hypothetical protein
MIRSESAARFVRRLSLSRGLSSWVVYVGKAIGWGTVVWMVGWVVIAIIAGAEVLPTFKQPISAKLLPIILSSLAGVWLLFSASRSATPPINLNGRDVYRLALTAEDAREVMDWPLWFARVFRFVVAFILGAIWTLISSYWFNTFTPFAALTLGCLAAFTLDLEWLAYSARGSENHAARRWLNMLVLLVLVFSLAGGAFGFGLTSGMWNSSVLGVLPVALLVLGIVGSRASLEHGYPPRFAAQSQVLSTLRSMMLMSLVARSRPDPDQHRRLRDQLLNRASSVRPTRSLPLPALDSSVLVGVAWRSALTLYRRPVFDQIGLMVQLALVAFSSSSIVSGVGGFLLRAVALGFLLPRLVGPAMPIMSMPIRSSERSLGRTLPGLVIIAVVGLVGLIGLSVLNDPLDPALLGMTRAMLGLLLLEKVATWAGFASTGAEAAVSAGTLALVPAALLETLGIGSYTLMAQVVVMIVLLLPTD